MPSKAQIPPALDLSSAKPNKNGIQPELLSASTKSLRSPQSLSSAPVSPFLPNSHSQPAPHKTSPQTLTMTATQGGHNDGPTSPRLTAMPEFPPSPKHGRDPSKSFFSNLMASKSSHKLDLQGTNNETDAGRSTVKSRANSRDRSMYTLRGKGSTPDLPRMPQPEKQYDPMPTQNMMSEPFSDSASQAPGKKGKSRLGGILHRTKSIKLEDGERMKLQNRRPSQLDLGAMPMKQTVVEPQYVESLRTAPLRLDHREKTLVDNTGSFNRNRSADNRSAETRPTTNESVTRNDRSGPYMPPSHSFRDGTTLQILSKVHQTSMGVGDRLGKAGKGFFGKMTRSDSSNARELVPDDVYVCTVINLPLVRQTRRTRIARRLELSKDKTEFWMPALPWRCIDYLNMNGCEEEGLYRIPGSGRDVKHWQRRFDTELDINLFDEPELYDINTIGSMFKSWLRELPDEIFPRKTQIMLAQRCQGATTTPQLLKDELSKLPPFNYYLLFAITCHLSLLHGFADKNKMDYRNLCICFQPCLKIDGFCFQFLVQDWKNCWQGCWTEKKHLEEEERYDREGSINERTPGSEEVSADDRAISSSGSSLNQTRQRSATRSTHRTTSSTGTAGHSQTASRERGNVNGYATMPPLPPSNGLHPYVHHSEPRSEENSNPELPQVQALSPISISPLANAG